MTTPDDWQFYVRDLDLKRVGVLVGADLTNLVIDPRASDVGEWTVRLPAKVHVDGALVPHRMCEALRQPGAGIVARYRGKTVFSGPMDATAEEVSKDAPDGEWLISGPSDDIVLADALAWPDPEMAAPQSARFANDVQTGQASELLAGFVRRNIGEAAPASRREALARHLSTDGVPALGSILTKSPRYQNLLELCREIAAQGGIHFRVLDVDGVLQLKVWQGRDLTKAIRWTVDDGFLDSLNTDLSAPGVTRPLVAGQDVGTARTIISPTTPEGIAAEERWGRRVEEFIDQRQTDDPVELTQKGLEAIATDATGVEVTPSPLSISGWPERWDLGDLVTVRTASHGDLEFPVTEVPISFSADGIDVSAVLGQLADDTAAQRSTSARLSNLERNESPIHLTGEIIVYAGTTVPAGYLECNGQAVSRSTYAELFAAIGTVHGTGNGTTTFHLPDHRERAAVGRAPGSAEFGEVGAKYGTKTHSLTVAESPSHNHGGSTGNGGGHSHGPAGSMTRFVVTDRTSTPGKRTAPATTSGDYVPAWAAAQELTVVSATDSAPAHGHSISSQGGGAAHNNLGPRIAELVLIKT